MNCPSRTDEVSDHQGWNQSPNSLSADLTTRQDLNGLVNLRSQRSPRIPSELDPDDLGAREEKSAPDEGIKSVSSWLSYSNDNDNNDNKINNDKMKSPSNEPTSFASGNESPTPPLKLAIRLSAPLLGGLGVLRKYASFAGPGFMIAVAYIDPGNYATDAAAGAATRFQLLFVVLMSNIFAVLLQSLAVRLGTVTGMNLAEHCRANLPKWLNIVLYVFAEAAIIATDMAEVIGSAIALNLLFHIPLVAGCAITLADVLIILVFYRTNGSLRQLRFFEAFIAILVLAVVICFCIQLALISDVSVGEVFRGYLPSPGVVENQGLYLSCGILGATVMPHSLYLGSGIVQARVYGFDEASQTPKPSNEPPVLSSGRNPRPKKTFPSPATIKHCIKYSTAELAVSLCIFALFVNSAILIVSGASLSSSPDNSDADLFGIHDLLASTVSPAAGTIFALALFVSGTSAGIVCTIAGQMVSEGQLRWSVAPWLRRLLTRSVSITPSIIVAAAVGRAGLSAALTASQVALSVILPFVSAPLIYFTCRNKYMIVGGPRSRRSRSRSRGGDGDRGRAGRFGGGGGGGGDDDDDGQIVEGEEEAARPVPPEMKMRNHWLVSVLAGLIWTVITVMNVALLVLLGLGQS